MESGIYKIEHESGKTYIGSAVNIKRRIKEHIVALKNNKHYNKKLQNCFNKHGIESFLFREVLLCEKEELIKNEQYYIDTLKPWFNICLTAGSPLGTKLSDDEKRKISIAHKGKKHTEEFKKYISKINKGEKNKFFGKKHSKETIIKVSGKNHHSAKSVRCIENGKVFDTITSARDWVRETKNKSASSSPIMYCCKLSSRYKTAYGYTWRYV